MKRLSWYVIVPLVLVGIAAMGCGVEQEAVDQAYASGYADGLAAAAQSPDDVDDTYESGYQDGLADATGMADSEVCQNCYGTGFAEGYQAGYSAGRAE